MNQVVIARQPAVIIEQCLAAERKLGDDFLCHGVYKKARGCDLSAKYATGRCCLKLKAEQNVFVCSVEAKKLLENRLFLLNAKEQEDILQEALSVEEVFEQVREAYGRAAGSLIYYVLDKLLPDPNEPGSSQSINADDLPEYDSYGDEIVEKLQTYSRAAIRSSAAAVEANEDQRDISNVQDAKASLWKAAADTVVEILIKWMTRLQNANISTVENLSTVVGLWDVRKLETAKRKGKKKDFAHLTNEIADLIESVTTEVSAVSEKIPAKYATRAIKDQPLFKETMAIAQRAKILADAIRHPKALQMNEKPVTFAEVRKQHFAPLIAALRLDEARKIAPDHLPDGESTERKKSGRPETQMPPLNEKAELDCQFDVRSTERKELPPKGVIPVDVVVLSGDPSPVEPQITIQYGGPKSEKTVGDRFVVNIRQSVVARLGAHLRECHKALNPHRPGFISEPLVQRDMEVDTAPPPIPVWPIFMPSKNRHGQAPSVQRTTRRKGGSFKANIPIWRETLPTSAPNASSSSNVKEIVPAVSNLLEKHTSADIFIVVEFAVDDSAEYMAYQKAFAARSTPTQTVFFVGIPGQLRGVGFARQMILVAQLALAHCVQQDSQYPPFDFFYMLDDDLRETRVYDRETFTMRPCSLTFLLAYLRSVMEHEIAAVDQRFNFLQCYTGGASLGSEDWVDQSAFILHSIFHSALSQLPKKFVKENEFKKLWTEDSLRSLVALSDRTATQFAVSDHCILNWLRNNLATVPQLANGEYENIADALYTKLCDVRAVSAFRVAMVSVPNRRQAELHQYNHVYPPATHRVALQHHALVLFHAPALRGIGYFRSSPLQLPSDDEFLRWQYDKEQGLRRMRDLLMRIPRHVPPVRTKIPDLLLCLQSARQELAAGIDCDLFITQKEATRRASNKQEVMKRQHLLIGEDKLLAEKLHSYYGRAGLLVYLFDADYGAQSVGGCFEFRHDRQRFASSSDN